VQNDIKKQKAREKRTHMTGEELRRMRGEMKFAPRDMRAELDLPRRTYQDYEAGKRGIPAALAVRIRELHRQDREWVAGIGGRVDLNEEKQP
jgi:predicted transcriptional regulator